jgi:hypothetical protein
MDRITSICKVSDVNEFNKIVGSNLWYLQNTNKT